VKYKGKLLKEIINQVILPPEITTYFVKARLP